MQHRSPYHIPSLLLLIFSSVGILALLGLAISIAASLVINPIPITDGLLDRSTFTFAFALAFQGLAEKADKIGQLNVSPELLRELLKGQVMEFDGEDD